jgi:hypothetical protein
MYCRFHRIILRTELIWRLLVPELSRRSPQLGLPKARFDGFPRTLGGDEANVIVTPLGRFASLLNGPWFLWYPPTPDTLRFYVVRFYAYCTLYINVTPCLREEQIPAFELL